MSIAGIDRLIARGAAVRYGVFPRWEVLERGMSASGIDRRIRSGRWDQPHPNVYVVAGAPITWHTKLLAACLWAGPGAAASHRAAAGLWALAGASEKPVEISTPRHLRSDSLQLHTRVRLQRRDVKILKGIPVTSVERTIIDLMAVCPADQVEIALDDALTRRLTTVRRIMQRLDDLPRNQKGRGGLTAMLDERLTGGWPNSPLETITNRIFRRFPLPRPILQFEIYRGHRRVKRVDFAYPELEVCVEPDGGWHMHKKQRQRDARTRNELQAMGWIVVVVTWDEVKDHPRMVYEQIRSALESRGRRRYPTPKVQS